MYGSIVALLNIGKTLIQCAGILGIVHAQDMHDHSVDDLIFSNHLGVEGSGFCEFVVQQGPEDRPKCVEEPPVPNLRLWFVVSQKVPTLI
jgi:hypothetical protein